MRSTRRSTPPYLDFGARNFDLGFLFFEGRVLEAIMQQSYETKKVFCKCKTPF
jgi:hypothetical protein